MSNLRTQAPVIREDLETFLEMGTAIAFAGFEEVKDKARDLMRALGGSATGSIGEANQSVDDRSPKGTAAVLLGATAVWALALGRRKGRES